MIRNTLFQFVLTCFIFCGCKQYQREYYSNGKLGFEVALKDGKREGKSTQYYETGELRIVSHWSGGIKEGESISYFKNGKINIKSNYKNNKANGEVFIYDSLSNLIETYEVEDDLKQGIFNKYFPTGQLQVKGEYLNDLPHGEGIEYYEDGKIFRKYVYHEGEIVYFKGYDRNGLIYDCVLPISIIENGKDVVVIRLDYTEHDSARIGVIIGELDEKKFLKDTIEVIGSFDLELKYKIPDGQKKVSGVLYEIKMPADELTGEYFFEWEFP